MSMPDAVGPPFPKPTLEEVLCMSERTPEDLHAKRAAASAWLKQYCDRARFVLDVRDLRIAIRTRPECRKHIDQIRRFVSDEDIDRILSP